MRGATVHDAVDEAALQGLLDFGVDVDVYDSTRYAVYANPADLGLGKAYLEDESMSEYWDAYKTLVTKRFVLYGVSEEEASEKTQAIFHMQTELAASTLSKAELRDFSTVTLLKDMSAYISMDYRKAMVDYTVAMNGVTPRELPEVCKDSVESDLEHRLL